MNIQRVDIVITDLDPTKGSEQKGKKPSIIVQNDIGNRNSSTTIIAPLTTQFSDELYPFEVLIESKNTPLKQDSVALCNQIRTISIEQRITDNIGRIKEEKIKEIDRALKISLGLKEI